MCMTINLVCDWLLVLVRMFPHFTACLLRCSHLLCQVAFVFPGPYTDIGMSGGGGEGGRGGGVFLFPADGA